MIAQAGSAAVEMALLDFSKAQNQNPTALNENVTIEKNEAFQMFGKDGLTFWDFLDIVNPLQHIPVISTLYRAITGDEIDPAAKIAGGTLFGGPIGAVSSLIDVAVEYNTGQDIGEHAMALLQETPATSKRTETANANPYLARAGITEQPVNSVVKISAYVAPGGVIAQEIAQTTSMTGIPVAKRPDLAQISAYNPQKSQESVGNTALTSRLKKADAAYQKMAKTSDSWLLDTIMNRMDSLDKLTPNYRAAPTEKSANLP